MADEQMIRAMEQQRQIQREQRAAMEEIAAEFRQILLSSGADPHVLREYELYVVDIALVSALERSMEARFRNLSDAAGEG